MKNWIRKFSFVLVLLLVLTSCGPTVNNGSNNNGSESGKSAEAQKTNTNEKEVILAAPRDLTPGDKDAYYCSLILEVWEPLVSLGEDGSVQPELAESWKMSEDGKEWTIKLKKGVVFHDNEPFNADAVLANIQRMLDHSPKKSPFYTMDAEKTYPNLEKLEKVDDYTVKLVFSVSSPSAMMRLTNFGSPMYSPKNFDENGDFNGFAQGTGPFRIVEHQPDQYTRLEAFKDYYGDKAKAEKVQIKSMPSVDTRNSALRAGEIQGVLDIGAILASQAKELEKDENFVVSSKPSTISHFLQVNQAKPKFNDPKLIKAISLAIDRNLLVNDLYYGYAMPSANPLNASEPGFVQDEVIYDLEKAKSLAKEVLGDERLSAELLVPQYGIDRYPYKEQAEYVQSALKDIGIDISIRILEGSEQMKLRNEGNYDMAFHTQGMPDGDPVTMLNVFMGPENKGNYKNEKAFTLLKRASEELDEKKRIDLYKQLQEMALETPPTIPLFHDHYLIVHHKDLKNYEATNYGVTLSNMQWSK